MANEEYLQSIAAWRQEVDNNLRRENGWLAVAGLFWLREGDNRVGSGPESEILLPARAPAHLGRFDLDGDTVTFHLEADLPVEVNGVLTKSARLHADQDDEPSFITFDDMRMVVVRRPRGVGIRLWDNAREQRRLFPSRQWYPVIEDYRLAAAYTRFETPKIVKMPDIFGEPVDVPMHGFVSFELPGKRYELLAEELPDRRLFIQFKDRTNGKATYPSGRYHYTEAHENGQVIVDFNKAYSPPCAFTEYATCTFPPPENRIEVPIEAGELYSGHYE